MRMTRLATVVSTLLLASAAAHAGDDKMHKEKWTAADKDRDGQLTLAEAQAGMPTLAASFASVDTNGDGKVSADEWRSLKASGDKSMEADEAKTPPTTSE